MCSFYSITQPDSPSSPLSNGTTITYDFFQHSLTWTLPTSPGQSSLHPSFFKTHSSYYTHSNRRFLLFPTVPISKVSYSQKILYSVLVDLTPSCSFSNTSAICISFDSPFPALSNGTNFKGFLFSKTPLLNPGRFDSILFFFKHIGYVHIIRLAVSCSFQRYQFQRFLILKNSSSCSFLKHIGYMHIIRLAVSCSFQRYQFQRFLILKNSSMSKIKYLIKLTPNRLNRLITLIRVFNYNYLIINIQQIISARNARETR